MSRRAKAECFCDCGHTPHQHVFGGVCLVCLCVKFRPDFEAPIEAPETDVEEEES